MFFCEINSLYTHFTNKVNFGDGVSACQSQFEGMMKPESERASSFTTGM